MNILNINKAVLPFLCRSPQCQAGHTSITRCQHQARHTSATARPSPFRATRGTASRDQPQYPAAMAHGPCQSCLAVLVFPACSQKFPQDDISGTSIGKIADKCYLAMAKMCNFSAGRMVPHDALVDYECNKGFLKTNLRPLQCKTGSLVPTGPMCNEDLAGPKAEPFLNTEQNQEPHR